MILDILYILYILKKKKCLQVLHLIYMQYIEQYMNKIEINNKENKQRSNYIQTILYIWLYLQKLKACIYTLYYTVYACLEFL